MENMQKGKLNVDELLKKASESSKNGEMNTSEEINDFIDKNLSNSQAQTVKEFLKDEEKTKALLNSDAAQALFQKFFGGK